MALKPFEQLLLTVSPPPGGVMREVTSRFLTNLKTQSRRLEFKGASGGGLGPGWQMTRTVNKSFLLLDKTPEEKLVPPLPVTS